VDSTEVVLHVDGLNTVNVSINGGDDELWHCYTPAGSTPLTDTRCSVVCVYGNTYTA